MALRPADPSGTRTRLSCERTNGYNVKGGIRTYEWCPFCGHRTDGDDHEIVITAPK